MARRSLKPQLNQVRGWVRQGRTDAWIAHQLEVSVRDIREFKREHGLVPGEAPEGAEEALAPAVVEEQPDLRAEDDALIAAELEAEPDPPEPDEAEGEGDEDSSGTKRRRRGRRGGRGRRRGGRAGGGVFEGTFDHGEEGYGLWLDPGVSDDPIYAEHWAGHRPVTVSVEADRIVIERAGEGRTPGAEDGTPAEGASRGPGRAATRGAAAVEDAAPSGDAVAVEVSAPTEDAGAGETSAPAEAPVPAETEAAPADSVTSGGTGSPSEP